MLYEKTIHKRSASKPLKRGAETLKNEMLISEEMYDGNVQSIVHELEVQNEELRRSKIEAEESRKRYADLYEFAPVGYFTFDEKGLILDVNLTGADQLEQERSFLIKKPFITYVIKDDRDKFFSYFRKVFKGREHQICDIRLNKKNGAHFYAQLVSIAVHEEAGNNVHCRTSISNITERKLTEEELRKHLEILYALINIHTTDM